MLSPYIRMGFVVVGVMLLVAALLGGTLLGSAAASARGKLARILLGAAGIALLAWALASGMAGHAQPAAHAVAVPAAAPRVAPPTSADLVQAASAALTACTLTDAAPTPDGASASREQMGTARSAFQAYDAATTAYTQCVDSAVERIAQQFTGRATEADLQDLRNFGARAHNVAIDQEQAAADQLNTQVRAYKAKHPHS
jgi:hypothetical protein